MAGTDNAQDPLEPNEDNTPEEAELLAKAQNGELTEADLQRELQNYQKALLSEFELRNNPEEVEKVDQEVKLFFRKNVSVAMAQIVYLAGSAESETVRLNSSKYIIELAREAEKEDEDPIADIIKSLQAQSANAANAANAANKKKEGILDD
jgi:hypothetical protein